VHQLAPDPAEVVEDLLDVPAQKVGPMWIVAAKDARAFKRLPRGKAGKPRKLK